MATDQQNDPNRELAASVERLLLTNNPQLAADRAGLSETVANTTKQLAAQGFQRVDGMEELPQGAGTRFYQGRPGDPDFKSSDISLGQAVTIVNGEINDANRRNAAAQTSTNSPSQAEAPTPTPANNASASPQPQQPEGFRFVPNGVALDNVTATLTTPPGMPNMRDGTVRYTDTNPDNALNNVTLNTRVQVAPQLTPVETTVTAQLQTGSDTRVTPVVGFSNDRDGPILGATVANNAGTNSLGVRVTAPGDNGLYNVNGQAIVGDTRINGSATIDERANTQRFTAGVSSTDGVAANGDRAAVPPSASLNGTHQSTPQGDTTTINGAVPINGANGQRLQFGANFTPGQDTANVDLLSTRDPNVVNRWQIGANYTSPGTNPATGEALPSGLGGNASFTAGDEKLRYGGAVNVGAGASSIDLGPNVAYNPSGMTSVTASAGVGIANGQTTPQANVGATFGNVEGGQFRLGASADPTQVTASVGFQMGNRIQTNPDGSTYVSPQEIERNNREFNQTMANAPARLDVARQLSPEDRSLFEQASQKFDRLPSEQRAGIDPVAGPLAIVAAAKEANPPLSRISDVELGKPGADGKVNLFVGDGDLKKDGTHRAQVDVEQLKALNVSNAPALIERINAPARQNDTPEPNLQQQSKTNDQQAPVNEAPVRGAR